jgi:predicted GNAT superfamily acetyltransferase
MEYVFVNGVLVIKAGEHTGACGARTGMEGSMIDYRVLNAIPDLEEVVSLQIDVWGLNPRNAVPSALLHVIALEGGLVLGAYDGERLVGLLLCLPARRNDEWILWSHMTGVHKDYRDRGIGLELKCLQRNWALQHGYRAIRWTMDPLQRANAHFNLHLLGRVARMYVNSYHVNFYGEMDDDINRGLPSDRVEVLWQLDRPSLHDDTGADAPLLLYGDERDYPMGNGTVTAWNGAPYRVSVPHDLEKLRQTDSEALLAWRFAQRELMQDAFRHGYAAVDFASDDGSCAYILKPLAET